MSTTPLTTGALGRWLAALGPFTVTRSARVVNPGQPATSRYVETFWLPELCPTGWAILRRLSILADASEAAGVPFTTSTATLGEELGFRCESGSAGGVTKAIGRLALVYGLIDLDVAGGGLSVPKFVPLRHTHQVPTHLQTAHAAWLRP